MIFQVIDDKKDCQGFYTQGEFIYGKRPNNLNVTWSYGDHVGSDDITCLQLYCNGKTIEELCPEDLQERFKARQGRIKAFLRSFVTAKVRMDDICLYDVIPRHHLRHFLDVKNEICEFVLNNYERPKNYSFLSKTQEMAHDISQQNVQINWSLLKKLASYDKKAMSLSKRFWGTNPVVNYNIFGTKTGRLGVHEGSFPILNLKKENRGIVIPNNDFFLELDFNGAELRTLLSLSGTPQPDGDIHEWNVENIFNGELERDEAKKKLFAWLYNPSSDAIRSEHYDRKKVLDKHYADGHVQTPFGRKIESDDFHSLNYLLQSASSDNCITQVNKIHRFLRQKKTNIAFIIHDSVILDLSHEDRYLVPQIVELFEDTRLGKFKSNMKIGKNLGDMREFAW